MLNIPIAQVWQGLIVNQRCTRRLNLLNDHRRSIMLRKAFIACVCLIVSGYGIADTGKKIWACAADGAQEEDLFLVAWGERSYVKLYEARIWGSNYQEGDDLRWDFGYAKGGTSAFSAVLKPDGDLDYYDFRNVRPGESIEASYHYKCRLAQG